MWKVRSSKEKYSSEFVKIYNDEVTLPNGREIMFSRLSLLDFATVLPVLSDKIIFIKNYRYPANEFFLELPSGIIEEGETPETCAHRELKEETGLTGVLRGNQGNVKPMHLTRRKRELLAKSNPDFHHSLIFGSVTLYGDDLEAPASPTT